MDVEILVVSCFIFIGILLFWMLKELERKDVELRNTIERKDVELRKTMERKDVELRNTMERKDVELYKLIKEKDKELRTSQEENWSKEKKLEILKHRLERTELEYLHATKNLSARGALELFEKRYVFKNSKGHFRPDPMKAWGMFIESDFGSKLKKKLQDEGITTPIPELQREVYSKVSEGVHSFFDEGMRKVYLVKSELNINHFVFLNNICLMLPLSPSDIVVLEKKEHFTFSPPRS